MTSPIPAIKTCLSKSFHFKGRTSRSEFWAFAPFGLALGILGSWVGVTLVDDGQPLSFLLLAGLTLIGFTPLLAAGSRRLQDTGEHGHDIFLPMMPIIFFMFYLSVFMHLGAGVLMSFFVFPPLGIVLGLLLWVISIGVLVLAPLVGLLFLGPTIGQLIVPSDPTQNRFGPNPNEVPS